VNGVVNVEYNETQDITFSGADEYGYGFWSKWMRTTPLYIVPKNAWY